LVNLATEYAQLAERYESESDLSKAIDAHNKAKSQFAECAKSCSDNHRMQETFKILSKNHDRRARELRYRTDNQQIMFDASEISKQMKENRKRKEHF
jgi:hypothetical protein